MPDDFIPTRIRRAVPEDAPALQAIEEQSSPGRSLPAPLSRALGPITLTPAYVTDNPVYVLQQVDRLLGFYGLAKEQGNLVLDRLFVDHDDSEPGHRRQLWLHALETARLLGFHRIAITAAPHLAAFYDEMGAEWIGANRSPDPARSVQLFRYDLSPIVIRDARMDEAAILHDLTGRSALSWGYEPEFLDWKPEAIAITPEFMQNATVRVIEDGGVVCGYYALIRRDDALYLDKLFVEPDRIGTGYGKRLWNHAVDAARATGATVMLIDADPNAAPFYRAMGAEWIGEEETTRPGWNLQRFQYPSQAGV